MSYARMPRPFEDYTKGDIVRAGKLLSKRIPEEARDADVIRAFYIANSWISSHAYPLALTLNRIRKITGDKAPTARVIGREKTLESARLKLQARSLGSIQDLGGARAIFDNMSELDSVVSEYHAGKGDFEILRTDDYIRNPKPAGYRSVHIIVRMPKFSNKKRHSHANQRIEIQLRTQLQHEWATAVEAIGLLQGVRLKNGQGDGRWLRVFALMGEVYRIDEEETGSVPEDIIAEIQNLDSQLKAREALGRSKAVTKLPNTKGYTILDFNRATGEVTFENFDDYDAARKELNGPGYSGWTDNAVLLQSTQKTSMIATYPNYFLNVPRFSERLVGICEGRPRSEAPRNILVTVPTSSGSRSLQGVDHLHSIRDPLGTQLSLEEVEEARKARFKILGDLGLHVETD